MEEPSRPPISVILPVQQESPPVLPPTSKKIPRWIAVPILIALLGFALYVVASGQGWWPFSAPSQDRSAQPSPTTSATAEPSPSAAQTGDCGSWNYDTVFFPLTGTSPDAGDIAAFACISDAIILGNCRSVTSTYSGPPGAGTYAIETVGSECAVTMRGTDNRGSTCYWNAQQLAIAKAEFEKFADVRPEEKMSVFVMANAIGAQPGWTCTSEAPCPRCTAF